VLHEPLDPQVGSVAPTTWRWFTEQLLRRAQHELDRADEKANTLFRLYGVVLAAGVGFAVTGYSQRLQPLAAWLLLLAGTCALVAGGMLAAALAPRDHRPVVKGAAPSYFGDVVKLRDRGELLAALHAGAADLDGWLVDQLQVTCTIVAKRYRLIRRATALTWFAIAMTMAAAVAQRLG
jgi:hypothetical protein